jgi:hypothetical protein
MHLDSSLPKLFFSMQYENSKSAALALLCLVFGTSCSTIATFDQAAYEHATSLKVDAMVVMNKATESYASHSRDIAELQISLDKAYEYDRNRPLNNVTIELWDKLRDPQGDLLGGFLREWKEDGPLLPKYVSAKEKQVAEAFDVIIQLESGKIRASEAEKKL